MTHNFLEETTQKIAKFKGLKMKPYYNLLVHDCIITPPFGSEEYKIFTENYIRSYGTNVLLPNQSSTHNQIFVVFDNTADIVNGNKFLFLPFEEFMKLNNLNLMKL